MGLLNPNVVKCPESFPWIPEFLVEVKSLSHTLSTKMSLSSQLRTGSLIPTWTDKAGSQECSSFTLEICMNCSRKLLKLIPQPLKWQELARPTCHLPSFSSQMETAHSTCQWATAARFSLTGQRSQSSTWVQSWKWKGAQHRTSLTFTWNPTLNSCHTTTTSVSSCKTASWRT